MRRVVFALAAACAAALSACSYDVYTLSSPQLNVYSNYTNKIPGKWALTVFVNGIEQDVHPTGFACSANHYPLNVSSAFAQSSFTTFQNMIEDVEPLARPIPAAELARNGFKGIIRVKGEELRTRLIFLSGFLSSTAQAGVEIDAGVTVDGPDGTLVGTRATGHGSASNDAGMYCEGGALALQLAAERAMRDVLGQLAERMSSTPQMRKPKSR